MPELARAEARELVGRAPDVRPRVVGRPIRDELDAVPVRIGEMETVVPALVGDAAALEVSGGLVEREVAGELERVVVEAGLAALRRARASTARSRSGGSARPSSRLALREAELDAPARDGLVEVRDSQADVVDSAET